MSYFNFLFSMLMMSFFYSCYKIEPQRAEEQKYSSDSTFTFLNLKYGEDALNNFDLYLPADRDKNTPIVILIHGGGWVAGDKSAHNDRAKELLGKNYIVANINYRFISQNNNYEGILKDVDNMVRFLKANSKKYGIEQNKFHIEAYSAGAHIAMLYAFTINTPEIETIISISGPTNINDIHFKKMIDSVWFAPQIPNWLLGENFVLNSSKVISCSPIYQIKNIPILFVHGTNDDTVPYEQSTIFNDSLNAKGIKHLFISIPGGTHFSPGPNGVFYYDSVTKVMNNWAYQK